MNPKFIHISEEHSKEDNIKEYINELPQGSVFYDLGANLGWFSLHAASKGLDVYAFEVDENNFSGLKDNIEANPYLSNIQAFNIGIADSKKIINLRTRSHAIGDHRKTLDLPIFSSDSTIISKIFTKQIEVNSLDNIIEENNLPYPNHLKVDIDGSEYAFLLGSPKVLDNTESMVIELFVDSEYFGKSIEILNKHGFKEVKKYDIPSYPTLFNYIFNK